MTRLAGDLAGAFDVVHNHSLHPFPVAMAGTLPGGLVSTLHTPPFGRLADALARDGGRAVRCVAVSAHIARVWGPSAPT